jgi:hypothetical protein
VNREVGQATVELVAAIPLLVLAGAVALQLLLVGYALTLVDGAAEAGSLALAAGRPARAAARDSLPAWAGDRVDVAVRGGEVRVRLTPLAVVPFLSNVLAVTSTSFARSPQR